MKEEYYYFSIYDSRHEGWVANEISYDIAYELSKDEDNYDCMLGKIKKSKINKDKQVIYIDDQEVNVWEINEIQNNKDSFCFEAKIKWIEK